MSFPRFIVIASLVALVGCGTDDADVYTASEEAQELYAQGQVHHKRRAGRSDADSAAIKFQAAVDSDANFGEAWAALAQARVWLQFNQGVEGQLVLAQAALERAQALDPDAVETQLARGYVAYRGYRDYDAALDAFLLAEEQSPDDPDIAGAIGNVYRRQGRLDDAVRYYERRAELNPSHPQAHTTLAGTYSAAGRYADLLTTSDNLLEIDDRRGHIWRFWAFFHSGDTAMAFATVPEIRAAFGPPGYFDVVQAAVRRDDDRLSALVDSIGFDINGGLRFEVSHYLWRSGQISRGRAAIEGWIADWEEALNAEAASEAMGTVREANVRSQLAVYQAFLGNSDEAMGHASRVLELRPETADAWVGGNLYSNVYTAYMVLGENDQALDILEKVTESRNGPSSAWAGLHPSYDDLRQDVRFTAAVAQRRSFERPTM